MRSTAEEGPLAAPPPFPQSLEMRAASTKTLSAARRMRKAMTLPEVILWRGLRGRGGEAVFRRQHPFGVYVLDFYCPQARLAVEVDGGSHEFSVERDAARDAWLARQGVRTFRIPAAAVLADPDAAVAQVLEHTRAALATAGPPLPR